MKQLKGTALLMVWANVPIEMEDDYNRWYNDGLQIFLHSTDEWILICEEGSPRPHDVYELPCWHRQ